MEAFKKLLGNNRKTTPDTKVDKEEAPTSSSKALTKHSSKKTPSHTTGFDDFFAPTIFMRDPFFDFMPALRNFERDANMVLSKSSPGYEITEDDSKYQIAIDVPGVKAGEMNVEVEQNGRVLHLSGGRKIQKKGEYQETRFDKRFWIGDNIETSKLTANLADGVLVVKATKKPREEQKNIKIPITEGYSRN